MPLMRCPPHDMAEEACRHCPRDVTEEEEPMILHAVDRKSNDHPWDRFLRSWGYAAQLLVVTVLSVLLVWVAMFSGDQDAPMTTTDSTQGQPVTPRRHLHQRHRRLLHRLVLDLDVVDMPILGEGQRWRRADEHGLFFNMRNHDVGSSFDTSCATRLLPLPKADEVAYHIVELEPYVSTFVPSGGEAVSIVHHMDVFVCDGTIEVG